MGRAGPAALMGIRTPSSLPQHPTPDHPTPHPGDFLSQVAFATESYLPAAAKQALLHAAADAPKAAAEPFELPPELEEQLERTRPSSESLVHPDTAAAAAAPTTVQ